MEEAWLSRYPRRPTARCTSRPSRRRRPRGATMRSRRNGRKIRRVRRVVTGALEIERAAKAHRRLAWRPRRSVYVADDALRGLLARVDIAEICITSGARARRGRGSARGAFRLDDVPGRRRGAASGAKAANARGPGSSRPRSAATPTIPMSRRAMPPRCANGMPLCRRARPFGATAARCAACGDAVNGAYVAAPLPPAEARRLLAVVTFLADQASKAWILVRVPPAGRPPVRISPLFELVMVWNRGISYGLFQQHEDWGRYGLVLLSVAAAIGMGVWLARPRSSFSLWRSGS